MIIYCPSRDFIFLLGAVCRGELFTFQQQDWAYLKLSSILWSISISPLIMGDSPSSVQLDVWRGWRGSHSCLAWTANFCALSLISLPKFACLLPLYRLAHCICQMVCQTSHSISLNLSSLWIMFPTLFFKSIFQFAFLQFSFLSHCRASPQSQSTRSFQHSLIKKCVLNLKILSKVWTQIKN